MIGVMWYIVQLTGSGFALGLSALCISLPSFLFMIYAGRLADTNKKREIMVISDFLNAVLMLVIGILISNNTTAVPLYILIFLSSTLNVFFKPALLASIPLIVSRDDLTQANASVNTTNQIANVLGPAVGGILISQFDIAWVFYLNAITFFISSVAELFITVRPIKVIKEGGYIKSFINGLNVLKKDPSLLRLIIVGGFLINLFLAPTFAFITYICGEVLEVGAKGLGTADSVLALGAVIGSLTVMYFSKFDKKKLAILGLVLEGVALLIGGLWDTYLSLLIWSMLLGIGLSFAGIGISTLTQLITPEDYLGRVNSVSGAFSAISVPLGTLVGGIVLENVNIYLILLIYGSCILLSSLLFINLKEQSEQKQAVNIS